MFKYKNTVAYHGRLLKKFYNIDPRNNFLQSSFIEAILDGVPV
jgi:hypothetical protein